MKIDKDLKQLVEMPKDGQFVAVWIFKGEPWSTTYSWIDGELHEWRWSKKNLDIKAVPVKTTALLGNPKVTYIVVKENV